MRIIMISLSVLFISGLPITALATPAQENIELARINSVLNALYPLISAA